MAQVFHAVEFPVIPPERIPANLKDDVVVVQSVKILDMASPLVTHSFLSRAMLVNQLISEAAQEVPDCDFIEIRAVRYDVKEDNYGQHSA